MGTRLFSVVCLLWLSPMCLAQLPSLRVSPINYFGRYHGLGYSDGYHECKEGKCQESNQQWKPLQSVSSFYGSPSMPPKSTFLRAPTFRPSTLHAYADSDNSSHYSSNSITPANPHATPAMPSRFDGGKELDPSTQVFPQAVSPSYPSLSPAPAAPVPPAPTTIVPKTPTSDTLKSVPSFYEQVPPAPMLPFPSKNELPKSPDSLDLPALIPSDGTSYRRTTPGAHSLLQHSMYQRR